MGNLFSNYEEEENCRLEENAARLYHMRINAYDPYLHGPKYMYVNYCRSQYQVDRLPKYVAYGPNYTPSGPDDEFYSR